MHRLSLSSVSDGSEELYLLFRMRGKQRVADLSMDEIQELEAFLNSKMDGTSTQIFMKHVPSTTGVVDNFKRGQRWHTIANPSKRRFIDQAMSDQPLSFCFPMAQHNEGQRLTNDI